MTVGDDNMKIELHFHTSEVSPCGCVGAEDGIKLYKEYGYDAVVVTDHFSPYVYESAKDRLGEEYKAEHSLIGYRKAKEAGEKYGVKVFLGCEICLYGASNDYLLYGIDEDFFNHPEYMRMRVRELSDFCRERGIILVQAHPMRNNMTIVRPELLDGIEINNGNPRHDSRNDIAEEWAEKYKMKIRTSGSDFHQTEDAGQGGIITDRDINSMEDLKKLLLSGDFRIIHKGDTK